MRQRRHMAPVRTPAGQVCEPCWMLWHGTQPVDGRRRRASSSLTFDNPFAGFHNIHRRGSGPDSGSRQKTVPAKQVRQATLTTFLQQASSRGGGDRTEGSQRPGCPDIVPMQQGSSPLEASSQQEATTSPTVAHASSTSPQASPQESSAAEAWQAIQARMKPPLCQHGTPCAMKRTTKQGPNKGGFSCHTRQDTFPASCTLDCIPVCYVCFQLLALSIAYLCTTSALLSASNPSSCGVGRYVYMCSRPPAADSEGQCKTFYFVDVYRSQERSTILAPP